jgi:hypothetical protein
MHRIFDQAIKKFSLFIGVFALSGCAQNYAIEKPRTRTYVPKYIDFMYKIDGKVQVKHSYLFGSGVKKCAYAGELAEPYMEDGQLLYPYKSAEMKNFFEKNGHIYQGRANRDNVVLGYPNVSRLGGDIDPKTGEQETIVTELWSFNSLCHSRIGSSEYTVYLQKTSSLSIAQEIAQTKKLLGGAWKKSVRLEPESIVQRGNNKWTVFKTWNRAMYLGDAAERWYLPLGDGSYYYKLIFTYKSAMKEHNDPEYLNARAAFDHILDSFEVRTLAPEESAAIVNPEPIEPSPSKKININ